MSIVSLHLLSVSFSIFFFYHLIVMLFKRSHFHSRPKPNTLFIGCNNTEHDTHTPKTTTTTTNRLKNEKRQSAPPPMKPPQPSQQPNHQHSVPAINASHSLRARHRSSNYRDSSLSPCSSDFIMSHSLNASSGSLSSVSLSDRSESTDCVEYIADVPFAGKHTHTHTHSIIHSSPWH